MPKPVYTIDGRDLVTLEEFLGVVGRVVVPGAPWGHNLDAFNDILRGGFGTPDGGFVLRWVNSSLSRERLGKDIFDTLVVIIEFHCPGGEEQDDGVELVLA